MSSASVIGSMLLLLMCLAASPSVSGVAGGILHIPSEASLAHCPSSCGHLDNIAYPYGIGQRCFRPGYELTCDNATMPPRLLLGGRGSKTVITGFDGIYAWTPIGFNITMRPGTKTSSVSWKSPVKGTINLEISNTLYVIGCGVEAFLYDHDTGDMLGSCMSTCTANMEKEAEGCDGVGCCGIRIERELEGFQLTLARLDGFVQQSDDVKVFVSELVDFPFRTSDLFSGWINTSRGNYEDAVLRGSITDQPSYRNKKL